jgi:hypothetical protein
VLFCHVASDVPDRPYPKLRTDKGLMGQPSVAFLDAAGDVVVAVPGPHSLERFQRYAERARELAELRRKAAAGDARAQAALLIAQLEERQLDTATAEARRKALADETDAERARLDELLFDRRLADRVRTAGTDRDARRRLGREFQALLEAGRRPSPHVTRGFWFVILEHAEASADARVYADALDGLRRNLAATDPGAPWADKLLDGYATTLARLRGR